jgi:hypothetical protein
MGVGLRGNPRRQIVGLAGKASQGTNLVFARMWLSAKAGRLTTVSNLRAHAIDVLLNIIYIVECYGTEKAEL